MVWLYYLFFLILNFTGFSFLGQSCKYLTTDWPGTQLKRYIRLTSQGKSLKHFDSPRSNYC